MRTWNSWDTSASQSRSFARCCVGGREDGYRFPEDFGHVAARLGGLKVGEIALAVGSPLGGERGVEDEQQRGVRLRGRGRGGVRREGVMMMWCVIEWISPVVLVCAFLFVL